MCDARFDVLVNRWEHHPRTAIDQLRAMFTPRGPRPGLAREVEGELLLDVMAGLDVEL
jgi:hypothetical protein